MGDVANGDSAEVEDLATVRYRMIMAAPGTSEAEPGLPEEPSALSKERLIDEDRAVSDVHSDSISDLNLVDERQQVATHASHVLSGVAEDTIQDAGHSETAALDATSSAHVDEAGER